MQNVILTSLVIIMSPGDTTKVVQPRGVFHSIMEQDLGIFFDPTMMGETIRYDIAGEKTINPVAFVNLPSADAKILSDTDLLAFKPNVRFARSALSRTPQKMDKVTVRGVRYRADNFEEDGVGTITVYLVRV